MHGLSEHSFDRSTKKILPSLPKKTSNAVPQQAACVGEMLYAKQRLLLEIRSAPALRLTQKTSEIMTQAHYAAVESEAHNEPLIDSALRKRTKRKSKYGRPTNERSFSDREASWEEGVTRRKARCGKARNQSLCDTRLGEPPAMPKLSLPKPSRRGSTSFRSLTGRLIEGVFAFAALVACLRSLTSVESSSGTKVRLPRERHEILSSCLNLHEKLLLSEALDECKAYEASLFESDADRTKLAAARNRVALVLYDLGRLEEAVQVQKLAAEADPVVFEPTLAILTEAWIVTDLMIGRILPVGLKIGFLQIRNSRHGKARLVLKPGGGGSSTGGRFQLEHRLAAPTFKTCGKFRACVNALDRAIAAMIFNESAGLDELPLLDASATDALKSAFNSVFDVLRRLNPKDKTQAGIYNFSKEILPVFLATFE